MSAPAEREGRMDEASTPQEHHDRPAAPEGSTGADRRRVRPGDVLPGLFIEEDLTKSEAPSRPPDGAEDVADDATPSGAEGASGWGSGLGLVSTLALLPLTGLAILPFWAIANLVADVSYWLLLVCYLLVGTALFFHSTQRLMLAAFFSARPPTPRELETLEPAWHRVLDAAGLPHDRYVLAVTDRPHVDAVAAGGHVVAVSELAMAILPPDELEAALAHELGHHIGLHSVSRLAALWLEAPLLLFARLGQWLELAAYVLALLFAWREEFGPAVGALVAGLGVRVATHLVPAALGMAGLVHGVRNLLGRFSTFQADQVAVDLGYGDELVDLLERMVEYRLDGDAGNTAESLLGGRSLIARRIDRIESRLNEDG